MIVRGNNRLIIYRDSGTSCTTTVLRRGFQEAYLKRITTKNWPLTSRKAAEYAWIKAWKI